MNPPTRSVVALCVLSAVALFLTFGATREANSWEAVVRIDASYEPKNTSCGTSRHRLPAEVRDALCRTAVIIRTAGPSSHGVSRIIAMKRALEGAVGSFMVSEDTTFTTSGALARAIANEPGAAIAHHRYAEKDLFVRTPAVQEFVTNPRGFTIILNRFARMNKTMSLAGYFHDTPISLALRALNSSAEFTYVIEDDVGYTGDIVDFLASYALNTTDLLVSDLGPLPPRWMWSKMGSVEFMRKFPSFSVRVWSQNQVQRRSAAFSAGVDAYLDQGIAGIGELTAGTFARGLNLSAARFDRRNINLANFHWLRKISEPEWEKIRTNETMRDQLFHKLNYR